MIMIYAYVSTVSICESISISYSISLLRKYSQPLTPA